MFSPRHPHPVRLKACRVFSGGPASFWEGAREAAKSGICAILMSGGDLDCSRYSVACWDPVVLLQAKGRSLVLKSAESVLTWEGDPLQALDRLLAGFKMDHPLVAPPFSGGLAGYAAYELKNTIERLPQTARDDLNLPDLFFFLPAKILVHDRRRDLLTHMELDCGLPVLPPDRDPDVCSGKRVSVGGLKSNYSHEDYLEAVDKVIGYIREGDIYQANLSQRFSFDFDGDPLVLWERLFEKNPAPFYAFIHAGGHQVLCTSMERFLFRQGDYLETRPIKGTRPRGAEPGEDARLRAELADSPKEHAELSMIVDLLRNDLSRVCQPRTVRVREHRRLEAYQNVHHAVSVVTGDLQPGAGAGEILRGTFPGGSITGCPKIRAMEIIDELEPHVRHVYTGSIGYLGWHGNMDLNIAIRTAVRKGGAAHFSVGGGIVFDSTPQDEYEETLHKARTLFETLRTLGARE